MFIEWSILTADQQQALRDLRQGRPVHLSRELAEQLRNLGLAEIKVSNIAISHIGLTLTPPSAS